MGIQCCPGETPCGNIYRPPSRSNTSFFAIVELVILAAVGILCMVDLYELLKWVSKDGNDWGTIEFLKITDYALAAAGLVFIFVGLFCSISQYYIRTGISCFCIAAILAVVIVILVIHDDRDEDSFLFNILYMVFMMFLAWLLWVQSNNLII